MKRIIIFKRSEYCGFIQYDSEQEARNKYLELCKDQNNTFSYKLTV